jgi:hypothetical protein
MISEMPHATNDSERIATPWENPDAIKVDASQVPNAVLQRLIEEVRHDRQSNIAAYNRMHNRHNRSR